jgi:hypothetical protein
MPDPVVRVASMTSGAMAVARAREALRETAPEEPAVVVRLILLTCDKETGEQMLVGSFLRRVSMPADLASPRVQIALDIFGERRLFNPTDIIWDEARQVCVVEVEWMVADAANIVSP